MLFSMTGFGKGEAKSSRFRFDVEVKSLNGRFLDIRIKAPKEFFSADIEVQQIVKKYVRRGRIEFNYRVEALPEIVESINIDESRLVTIFEVLSEIKDSLDLEDSVTLNEILSFKEFFMQEETEWGEDDKEAFLTSIELAVQNMLEMRRMEGKNLENDIKRRLKKIERIIEQIETIFTGEGDRVRESLFEKLSSLLLDKVNLSRLEEEVFYYFERLDISEEIVRIKSHLNQFAEALKSREPVGRKLDFLSQELAREANTVASKSISKDIVSLVVDLKSEIEKIREQVQNVE